MKLRERLQRVEPFWSDLAISVCSAWAATCLFVYPSDFDKFSHEGIAYDLLQRIVVHERVWATLVLVAAITKISGLFCLCNERWWGASIILRKVGFTMSFLWWTILGVSAMSGGYAILGFLPCLIGFRSALLVLSETALPS